jgi:tRNA dimethylallyltransferase
MSKTCIIISGPTAVGKTSVAIAVARHFQTEIISADSRQCFKELNIGVAKPSPQELAQVKHHFIDSHSIHDDLNAAGFEQYALQAAHDIFLHHDIAVMTGGTGLYIKAFCQGMDEIPPVLPGIRENIMAEFERSGLPWLQQQVKEQDPLYYATGEVQNPQRLVRALEVVQSTGRSIRSFQQGKKIERDFKIINTALELPKEELHHNINHRVDEMMLKGLLQEVKDLLPWRHLNALQTVGYTELFEHLEGKYTLEEAVEQIKKNTRHYAKRQMTWFRRDATTKWFSPKDITALIDHSQAGARQ